MTDINYLAVSFDPSFAVREVPGTSCEFIHLLPESYALSRAKDVILGADRAQSIA